MGMKSFSTYYRALSASLAMMTAESSLVANDHSFFEMRIRPVLAEKCYECHSAKAAKIKGGLRLDHIDFMKRGGDSGPVLVEGKPEESLLIQAIRYDDPDFQMPPKEKLDQRTLSDFEQWILQGASWPDEPTPQLASSSKRSSFQIEKRIREHWSWRPISKSKVPVVEGENLSEIDSFIRARLKTDGLIPAEEADKRTWLRRVSYDLTGLPPSVEEINQFLGDPSADSHKRVVERLLGSVHFGEKWARHWMDLVRYAETCGHEFDYPLEHSHEYRDYLIRAFNGDVPYDQFLKEHVAGDLMADPRRHSTEKFNESIIGTGFWYFHEAVHAPTDPKQDNADRMESQLDVFGKTFLGLTIGCARCHDHKFDAISEKDYYSLASYMQGSTRQEYPLDDGGKRSEIARQLSKFAEEAFTKLTHSKLDKGRPSEYWKLASELLKPSQSESFEGDPWKGNLIADFEEGLEGWKPVGKAFGKSPQRQTSGRNPVTNYHGKGWAGSLISGGDKWTGELHSPTFRITERFMNFLVAGGSRLKVGVELWIDDERKLVSRGSNKENFTSRTWDLKDYFGFEAQIRLIDSETGSWGHIHADRFVLSATPVSVARKIPIPPFQELERLAHAHGLSPDLLESWCKHFKNEKNLNALSGNFEKEKNSFAGLTKAEENFFLNSIPFADFKSDEIPEGWRATGEAFKADGNQRLSLSGTAILTNPETFNSSARGIRRVGNLRSPHFKIEHDHILIKANSNKAFVRVVIDNFHMAIYNGLLFNGTLIKEANSDGEFKWFSLNTSKYKGHWAYLEVVDKGQDAFIEIDQVRFANGGAGRTPQSDLSYLFKQTDLVGEDLPKALDGFYERMPHGLKTGSLTLEEIAFINYLHRNGLLAFVDATLQEILIQASELDDRTPRERYVLAMGKGSPFEGNVYVRGSPNKLGDPVSGRNLTALGGKEGDRLDLANQLVAMDNPLVARVMANRIWLQFFGRGIVPTPDDFGPMGQEPTHPELLDWLANDFRENDWSLKSLMRKIVLSKTYRQSSALNPSNDRETVNSADPQNLLLYKMPVRRLQAEFIRDSILSFSGRLDRKLYGKSIAVHRTAFMTGRGGRGSGPLDGAGRRSVYGSVYRNFLSPFMLAFDQPAPFGTKGRRSVSNVPAQSLALLNDPFVIDQCKLMGKRIFQEKSPETEAIRALHTMIVGKPPSAKVQDHLLAFLETQSKAHGNRGEQVWADLAHVLINSKGFLFLN